MASHTLSRQQIRERRRHLEREEKDKRDRQVSLAELNEADRLLEQKRQSRHQMALQTGSLAVAILAQIPEKRDGIQAIEQRAIDFLNALLDAQYTFLTFGPDQEDEDDDDEDDDEPALTVAAEKQYDAEAADLAEVI
jgi:hypothetical protein